MDKALLHPCFAADRGEHVVVFTRLVVVLGRQGPILAPPLTSGGELQFLLVPWSQQVNLLVFGDKNDRSVIQIRRRQLLTEAQSCVCVCARDRSERGKGSAQI